MTNEPGRLFEHFRRSGDSEALGRVFDATAPRLLQLAIHLVGDIGAAEDVVQATFVTAIERAAAFDATRNLDAWLAGILANHARDLKKAAQREIDVASLAERVEATPLENALHTEWSAALAQALDAVPEPYRVVLILRLQHGLTPTQIAHTLQRSPGAVRVQLHRGREMLRKLLPAGIVASAMFIAEPGRGLAQVKAKIIADAALAKSSIAVAGVAGGVLMSTKVLVSGAAILIALLALFLARERAHESARAIVSMQSKVESAEARVEPPDEIAQADSSTPVQREEVVPQAAPNAVKLVKLHGRVFDVDTDAGIAGAEVRFYLPQSMRLSEIRRRWHDRFDVSPDGTVSTMGWPAFGAIPAGQSLARAEFGGNFTNETRLGLEDLTVYASPPAGAEPIARAVTDAHGEFEFPVDESLGFLVCTASGYGIRERSVVPAVVNPASSDDVSIEIAMRAGKPLAGYIVDENLKRIERRVRLGFFGYVNKPSPVQVDGNGKVVAGAPDKDPQVDTWIVDTKPDGSFACELPAKMVYARCLAPDLDVVKQGFLRDGGTKFVHEVWPEPGLVSEPLVIVLQEVGSLLVRDRKTGDPIEDIHLLCTRDSNGFPLRFGQFFAPHGRLRLAREDAVDSAMYPRKDELSPCECTVWADGYSPATQRLRGLTQPGVIEFDLERGELPEVAGRVHDRTQAVASAKISLAPAPRDTWTAPGPVPIVMTTSGTAGQFRLGAPSGRYVMRIVAGTSDECRTVDLPSSEPIDIDLSVDTAILASVHDSSGAACSGREVLLRGVDGRRISRNTDDVGSARFSGLSAGRYSLRIMNAAVPVVSKPDQEISIDLREGDQSHADFVIPLTAPRFARLVVEGAASLADWRAISHRMGAEGPPTSIESDGRIPIDIRGLRTLRILSPDAREWTASLPKDAPDGHEIRIVLDGLGYEGIVTSQTTGKPLKGLRVIARRWNDPSPSGLSSVAATDDEGRFKLMGLVDDEYSIRFQAMGYSFEQEGIYLHTTDRPRSPPARLAISLPRRKRPLVGAYEGHGYDGFEEITLSGSIHGSSGTPPRIDGFIGSFFPKEGYTLILYTEIDVGPDGAYQAIVPAARNYAASLRNAATGEGIAELEWAATLATDHEVHDIELP